MEGIKEGVEGIKEGMGEGMEEGVGDANRCTDAASSAALRNAASDVIGPILAASCCLYRTPRVNHPNARKNKEWLTLLHHYILAFNSITSEIAKLHHFMIAKVHD